MSAQFSIVGCQHGHISGFISKMLEKGYTCAGIYDSGDQTQVKKLSGRFNIPIVHDDEPLFSSSVHIVGTSAMNSEKMEIIEKCEQYGKHVIVDKPMVTNRDGLRRLEALLARKQIQIGMLLPKRFDGYMNALKQEIERGSFGDIVNISIRSPHLLSVSSRPEWFFSRTKNGGLIHDLLIHDFDLLRWLTGKEIGTTQSVMTKNILPEYPDFYDTVTMQLLLGDKMTVQLYADWHTPVKSTNGRHSSLVVVGTKGSAEYVTRWNPVTEKDERKLWISNEAHSYLELDPVPVSNTAILDFLGRVEGRDGTFTHHDILTACRIAVEADEQALCLG